jgi:hypothetical protein
MRAAGGKSAKLAASAATADDWDDQADDSGWAGYDTSPPAILLSPHEIDVEDAYLEAEGTEECTAIIKTITPRLKYVCLEYSNDIMHHGNM